MTLPTLLQDNLTGANDPMAGRSPDAISSGAWANDVYFVPGSADDCFVSAGQVQMHGVLGAVLFGPLAGEPNNAFVSVPFQTDTFNQTTPVLGVCHALGLDQGVFAKFTCDSPVGQISVNFQTYGTPPFSGFVSTPVTPASTATFTLKLEVIGRTINAYVDGTLVGTATLNKYLVQGGGCYIESGNVAHFMALNSPLLAGGEYIPPPAACAGKLSSGLSNFTRLFAAR